MLVSMIKHYIPTRGSMNFENILVNQKYVIWTAKEAQNCVYKTSEQSFLREFNYLFETIVK